MMGMKSMIKQSFPHNGSYGTLFSNDNTRSVHWNALSGDVVLAKQNSLQKYAAKLENVCGE